jgi:hypothetical protein
MNNKTLKILGIVLLAISGLSVVAAIVLWFANYIAMQEGHYQYGDPIMNAFGVCCCTALLGYVGLPLLIIGASRNNRDSRGSASVTYKSCSSCGAKCSSDALFCTQCGQKLS